MFYIIVISYLIDYVSSDSTLLGKCTVKSDLQDSRLDQLVGNDYETTHKRDYDGKKSNFRFNFCGDGLSYATVSVEQVREAINDPIRPRLDLELVLKIDFSNSRADQIISQLDIIT